MPPRRRATCTPETFLDAIKADMMEGLHMDEAQWADAVGEVLVGFEDARGAMDVRQGEVIHIPLPPLVQAPLMPLLLLAVDNYIVRHGELH